MNSDAENPVRVAIAGLGRSGWHIHAETIDRLPGLYRVVAACDPDPRNRSEVEQRFGCRAFTEFEDLLTCEEAELVVVATPSMLHTEQAIAVLRAGKHAVCEKPMALDGEAAGRMLDAAGQSPGILAPFQNRRYAADLLKVREVIASGRLGRIVQIKILWHGFGRRWDWQTLREFGGGALNNNGPHLVDTALQFYDDEEPRVFADLQRALSSGDAEDHVKIVLRSPGGRNPTIDLELTGASAYPQDCWHVMGTSGGLRGSENELEWKWVDFSSMPPRPASREAADRRAYNAEELTWTTESWTKPADTPDVNERFYRDLFETLRRGAPLVVTAESVWRQIRVLEACREAAGV